MTDPRTEPKSPPDDVTFFHKVLLRLQRALRREKRRIERDPLSPAGVPPDTQADGAVDDWVQEFHWDLLERDEAILREVEEALERVAAGKYGACEACGKPIPRERLRAIPYARTCVACGE